MERRAGWTHPYFRPSATVQLAILAAVLFLVVAALVTATSFLWPTRDLGEPATRNVVGRVADFEVHEPVYFREGDFWLVRQPGDSFLAFHARVPDRACIVAWRPHLPFVDPRSGVRTEGWFRDPCWGATYNVDGVHVFGPSPRSLDQYPVIVEGDDVIVRAAKRYLLQGLP